MHITGSKILHQMFCGPKSFVVSNKYIPSCLLITSSPNPKTVLWMVPSGDLSSTLWRETRISSLTKTNGATQLYG